jgi:hypothetical protein
VIIPIYIEVIDGLNIGARGYIMKQRESKAFAVRIYIDGVEKNTTIRPDDFKIIKPDRRCKHEQGDTFG